MSKNTDFHVFGYKRITSKIQSAANVVGFDEIDKTAKIECDWVGVLTKITVLGHVLTPTGGNTFRRLLLD